ncbi:SCO family protein [Persephonella sp.]
MRKLIYIFLFILIFGTSNGYEFYGIPYSQKIKNFNLTDHSGNTFHFSEYKGKILLVFFGYTYCPDVCPATMTRIKEILNHLGDYKKFVKVLFITVDPERDTSEKLKEYVGFYDENEGVIIGLTGKPEDIKKVAKNFRAFYEKVEVKNSNDYLIDHTAFIYLIGSNGYLKLIYSPNKKDPKRIAEDIIQVIKLEKLERK